MPGLSHPYLTAFLAGPGAVAWMKGHSAGSAIRSVTVGALDEKIRVHEEIARTTGLLRESVAGLLMSGQLPVSPE
ncbi:hypothetical protein [Streptomyces sp. NPDC014623]|uniref:hypothetical protein n=1 Tax=Streptomyces sp. NPDC014623 TaxID=3364875 RepID=UPI0036F79B6A